MDDRTLRLKLFLLLLLIYPVLNFSQVPTTCFEIESILVDACGSPEGANEMVRFRVGSASLNTSDLFIVWPNAVNQWNGICQDAGTAADVAYLNSTITGCDLLLEPTGGVLPAGANVLLITSTDFDSLANSFADLNDTLIVIFQCCCNVAGHFKNFGNTLPYDRTMVMSFAQPGACVDSITYMINLLVNQSGNTGGTSQSQDGSRVDYLWNGTPFYANDTCRIPITRPAVSAPHDTSLCRGANLPLSAAASPNHHYQWSGGTGSFANANSLQTNYTTGPGDPATFWLYLAVRSGCETVMDSMLVSLTSPPNPDLGRDTLICAGDSLLLDAGPGWNGYLWQNGASGQFHWASAGTIWVETTTMNCPAARDSLQIAHPPPVTAQSSQADISCFGSSDGSISVSAPAGGIPPLLFSLNQGTAQGAGTFDSLGPGIYTLFILDSLGCPYFQGLFTLNEPPLLSGTFDPVVHTACPGDSNGNATLVPAGGTPPYSYFWNTSPAQTTAAASGLPAGTWTASLTDQNGCAFSDSVSILDGQGLGLSADVRGTCEGIPGGEASISVAGGTPGYAYNWLSLPGNSGPSATDLLPGNYTVLISDAMGCTDTITVQVPGFPNAIANFITDPPMPGALSPNLLNVTCTHLSQNASFWFWDFGDGQVSTDSNPVVNLSGDGPWCFTLIAGNADDCNDTLQVCDFKMLTISIPNTFTPNADGLNDRFEIRNIEAVPNNQLSVFNRWGNLIFEATDYRNDWDGSHYKTGKGLPDGAYFYIFQPDGQEWAYKGDVVILR